MKIVPNRIFIILVMFLLQLTNVFAEPQPPTPSPPPPPPPGLSLDGGIVLLIVLSLFYGLHKLNTIKNTKKASN